MKHSTHFPDEHMADSRRRLGSTHRMPHHRWMVPALLLLAGSICLAQPSLKLQRITQAWPNVTLDFVINCAGLNFYDFDETNIELFEDQTRIQNFTLWIPDTNALCDFSAALVLDCSASMQGVPLADEIKAAHVFISAMDGSADQCAIIRAEETASVLHPMSTDTTSLHAAVAGLTLGSHTALWDGAYLAVEHLSANAINACRAILVITDGIDNTSAHLPTDVAAYATREGITIHGISILGGNSDLQKLALSTGGTYHAVNPAGLTALIPGIVANLSKYIRQNPECRVTYQSSCQDGAQRQVFLKVRTLCHGNAVESDVFTPPRDTTTFTTLVLRLDSVMVVNGDTARVALRADPGGVSGVLEPSTFIVRMQPPACGITPVEVATPEGCILPPSSITAFQAGSEIHIRTHVPVAITDTCRLAELLFVTAAVRDTCRTPLTLEDWQFDRGCFRAVLAPGQVHVTPTDALITGSILLPDSASWDNALHAYQPNPIHVSMFASNTGFHDATNVRFTIEVDPPDLRLISPTTATQPGTPPTAVKEGGGSLAAWDLVPLPRQTSGWVTVCITAASDNHPDVRQCARIWIPAAGPIPKCSITSDSIRLDNLRRAYIPMPFTLTTAVWNEGGMPTDTLFATLTLPPGLSLAEYDAPGRFSKTVSLQLPPGVQTTVTWRLQHAPSPVAVTETVRVMLTTRNAESSICDYSIHFPAINAPVLSLNCSAPDNLLYDEAINAYVPHPFDVRVSCRNLGVSDAENCTAFLWLPRNVVLVNPMDSLRKTFNPRTLASSNTTPAELSWKVRYATFPHQEDALTFRISAGAGSPFTRVDSVTTSCTVTMPPLRPLIVTGTTDICPGDSVLLDTGPGYHGHRWTTGDSTRAIVVRQPGAYACWMFDNSNTRVFSRTVTVRQRQLAPTIAVLGSTTLCAGDSTRITTDAGHVRHVWSTGDTTRAIVVRAAGTYSCTVTDAGGCFGTTPTVAITMRAAVRPAITIRGHLPICAGDSVELDAGAGWLTHQWNSGATTRSITLHSAGTFACTVTDSNGCSGTSMPVVITTSATPAPVITRSGPDPLCEGDTLILDAGSGYASHHWSTGDATRQICVTASGTYSVTVLSVHGCSGTSLGEVVSFLPPPPTPGIVRSGNTLVATVPSASHEWRRDGVPIPGATSDSLPLTRIGSYTVTVVSAGGCTATSVPFLVDSLLDVEALPAGFSITVHPNPVRDRAIVTLTSGRHTTVDLALIDIHGRICLTRRVGIDAGVSTTTMDMSSAPAGTWFLRCTVDGITTHIAFQR